MGDLCVERWYGIVWAEVHVFEGRWFVTQQWGSTGVAVSDTLSDGDLGQAILDRLDAPAMPMIRRAVVGAGGGGNDSWRVFCEEVAGVAVRRFRPEKRVRAFAIDGGWQVDAKPMDFDAVGHLVADAQGAAGLGAAVRRELEAVAPQWPMVRRATIMTAATGQLVVMPVIDLQVVGPARILGGGEPSSIAPALRDALADADREGATVYEVALAEAGFDHRLLNGSARVLVDELSEGTIRLEGYGMQDGVAVKLRTWLGRVEDLSTVGGAAAEMISSLPTEHLPPGAPSGSSFGYKCSWFAVRGQMEEVAAAIGLTGVREVSWEEGVKAAYDREVFVSPPTQGWVFAVGARLPLDGRAVAQLSARLGTEVQFFGTHRVSEYHEWALARDGVLLRRVVCGDGCKQEGDPTPGEIALGIPAMQAWNVNEETVMQVAAAWSLDPTGLHLVESSAPTGLLGRCLE